MTRPDHSLRLLLCVPAGWESYISCEFYELHQLLISHGWLNVVLGDVDDGIVLEMCRGADAVLLWEAYEFIERNHEALTALRVSDGPLSIVFCDDVHFFTQGRRKQRSRLFEWAEIILATYPRQLRAWFPELATKRIYWMPHSAASCFYYEPGREVRHDRILLSGSRTWPYPFRQFCEAKLPSTSCFVLEHPGYPGYPGDRNNLQRANMAAFREVGRERYADVIGSFPAMLICGSIFHYLVAKVFEAMATGCLVICERTSLGACLKELGFIESVHYLGTDISSVIDDVETLRTRLETKDPALEQMRTSASKKIVTEHTTSVRARQIHQLCLKEIYPR